MKKEDAYRKTFSMALITIVIFAITLLRSPLNHSLVQWLLVMVTVLGVTAALMAGAWVCRSKASWGWPGLAVLYLGLFIGMLIAAYFALVYVWLHHSVG